MAGSHSNEYFLLFLPFSLSVVYLVIVLVVYQVHTLLKGLEKIAVSADIPMLVCGDFNAVPGRLIKELIFLMFLFLVGIASRHLKYFVP